MKGVKIPQFPKREQLPILLILILFLFALFIYTTGKKESDVCEIAPHNFYFFTEI